MARMTWAFVLLFLIFQDVHMMVSVLSVFVSMDIILLTHSAQVKEG